MYQTNSGFTISNLKEIARKFNDYQIVKTISPELNLAVNDKPNFSKTSLAMLRFLSRCPDEVITNAQRSSNPSSSNPMFGGVEWSAIPSWLRGELDISSGQDGKTLEPKIEFTFHDIMFAQGKLFLQRRIEDGLLTERALLGIRRQDGEQIFGASIIARTRTSKAK